MANEERPIFSTIVTVFAGLCNIVYLAMRMLLPEERFYATPQARSTFWGSLLMLVLAVVALATSLIAFYPKRLGPAYNSKYKTWFLVVLCAATISFGISLSATPFLWEYLIWSAWGQP